MAEARVTNVKVSVGYVPVVFSADFAREVQESTNDEWSKHRLTEQHDDSLEYLYSASSKWTLYDRMNRVVRSPDELVKNVQDEPKGEFLAVLTVSSEAILDGKMLGFCQFRRTWSNNVVFDYLAIHPLLLTKEPPVKGVGTALLAALAQVVKAVKANRVWAETSEASVGFYSWLFGKTS